MGIAIKGVEIVEIGVKAVEIQKVYLKDVQVWEPPSAAGAVLTTAIDNGGRAQGDYSGTYTNVPQDFSDESGTGAKFDITISYVANKNLSTVTSQSINLNNQGSGYIVGEVITLDMSGIGGTWNPTPDIEVLTVTT